MGNWCRIVSSPVDGKPLFPSPWQCHRLPNASATSWGKTTSLPTPRSSRRWTRCSTMARRWSGKSRPGEELGRCFGLKNVPGKNPPPPNIPGWKRVQGVSVIFNEVKKAVPELGKCRKHGVLGGFARRLQPAEEEEERKISHLLPRLPRLDRPQSQGFSPSRLQHESKALQKGPGG